MTDSKSTPERPRYAVCEAVKEAVPIEEYADTLTKLRNLRGRCPVHGGDNPQSFAVYPAEGRWHCFRCDEGGDVIDLCRAVEGGELWEAVVSLSLRYGVEMSKRPPQWFDWQDQKGRIRGAAKKHVAEVYQRRLTRVYAPLVLLGRETTEEGLEALEALAKSLWPVALDMAARRVSSE